MYRDDADDQVCTLVTHEQCSDAICSSIVGATGCSTDAFTKLSGMVNTLMVTPPICAGNITVNVTTGSFSDSATNDTSDKTQGAQPYNLHTAIKLSDVTDGIGSFVNNGNNTKDSTRVLSKTLDMIFLGCTRSRWKFALPLIVSGLTAGCVPGMYAKYDKTLVVKESVDEPDSLNYQLLKVTPLVIRELQDQEETAGEFAIKGHLVKPNTPSYPYRIGPQDVISISVWGFAEFDSETVTNISSVGAVQNSASSTLNSWASRAGARTVDYRGYLHLPLIGDIKASGLTVHEFRSTLIKRLAKFVKEPQVEVSVVAFRSQKVFIVGEVQRPSMVPITDQPLTLVDALGQVGGPTEAADYYDVTLTRGNNQVRLNIDRLYYAGDMSVNILLQDGDIVSVPDKLDRKVFILGEVGNSFGVNQARSYVMRRGRMSLTEVLADAGGINPFSSAASEVYVVRANKEIKSPTQAARNPIVYKLDASNPEMFVLADQFPMQPRDIVFINPTVPTVIGRFIGQFLPILNPAVTVSSGSPF